MKQPFSLYQMLILKIYYTSSYINAVTIYLLMLFCLSVLMRPAFMEVFILVIIIFQKLCTGILYERKQMFPRGIQPPRHSRFLLSGIANLIEAQLFYNCTLGLVIYDSNKNPLFCKHAVRHKSDMITSRGAVVYHKSVRLKTKKSAELKFV